MSRPGTAQSGGRRFLLCHRDSCLLLTLMDLVQIYQCFCDRTRLRILHLLTKSPLCVCHFQTILGEPQVKISKHLAYLRDRGLVEVERDQNWMVYSLPKKRAPELEANLQCLQDCVQSDKAFASDLKKLTAIQKNCCEPRTAIHKSARDRRRYGKAKRLVHLRS
jgi:ArsR family transcriptional regulator, arsenate/arsenite/antimonite-responsive transcriptional repressor